MKIERPFWQRRLLPVCAVLAAVNLLAFAAWTGPRGYKQRGAAARARVLRAEVARMRGIVAEQRQRADAIRGNTADLATFYREDVGTVKNDLVPMLEDIETMAREPGLKPGARSLSRKPIESTALEQVSVNLQLDGSYEQLVRFLRAVEVRPRFLTVDRVTLGAGKAQTATLQVELSAYMKAAPEAAGARRGGRAR